MKKYALVAALMAAVTLPAMAASKPPVTANIGSKVTKTAPAPKVKPAPVKSPTKKPVVPKFDASTR